MGKCQIRLITFLFLLAASNAGAQMYIGITGDYGNQVNSDPPSSLIKNPKSPSFGIKFFVEKQIQGPWSIQFGVGTGVLGYNFKIMLYDTLPSTNNETYTSFPSYNTLYFSGNIGLGRHFQLNRANLSLFLGGGITYYAGLEEEGKAGLSYSVILFEYEMSIKDSKPKPFVEVSGITKLGSRISVGLQYIHHFNPALEGSYNFYQAKSSGQPTLTQRALRILFLIRVSRS